ncbi:hypothetical protein PV327_005446 [Microctonus hyperodae]|uniref:Uncharacterized protein n=1 Tax=Microctonus hyperodae TaxID=165561 RepID=A0AA39G1N0_MICHY|nr:hypothetical protein PV327_005446 [Microctonus hyperodae]
MTDTLTEFEESLLFDVDDPDFASPNSQTLINTMKNNNQGIFKVDYMPNINIMSSLHEIKLKVFVMLNKLTPKYLQIFTDFETHSNTPCDIATRELFSRLRKCNVK